LFIDLISDLFKEVEMGIGGHELLLILLIVLLLFGAKKIPELAKGLGSGLREFKKASSDAESLTSTEENNTKQKSEKSS
jgi:sec-independent protein translocase protein TatA